MATSNKTKKLKNELIKEHNLKETVSWQKQTEIIPMEQREKMENYIRDLVQFTDCESNKDWTRKQLLLRKKYKICPRKAQLKVMYQHLLLQKLSLVDDIFKINDFLKI